MPQRIQPVLEAKAGPTRYNMGVPTYWPLSVYTNCVHWIIVRGVSLVLINCLGRNLKLIILQDDLSSSLYLSSRLAVLKIPPLLVLRDEEIHIQYDSLYLLCVCVPQVQKH